MDQAEQIQSAYVFMAGNQAAYVYSTAKADNGIKGSIFYNLGGEIHRLTEEEGDYDSLKAAYAGGKAYIVYSQYDGDGANSVCLTSVGRGQRTVRLAGPGKFFNPEIATYGGRLFIVWENREAGGSALEYAFASLGDLSVTPARKVDNGEARCYAPCAAVLGSDLILGYEAFESGRYRIRMRRMPGSESGFSRAYSAGFSYGNDTSPAFAASSDGLFFSFENSSPLDTEYEWHEQQTGRTITMPAFGHGWRVKGRMGIGRVTLSDSGLLIETIRTDENEDAFVREESDGMPKLIANGGGLHVTYLSHGKDWQWRVKLESWVENGFFETGLPEFAYKRRIAIPCASHGDRLYLFKESETGCGLQEITLPKAGPLPVFRTAKCAGQRAAVNEKRASIEYENRTLSLFWGDLHMHSNISMCSRHPKFHCTEVEEKHRFSRDVGNLDFCMLTDHTSMDDVEWQRTRRTACLANDPGRFASFAGFEWSCTMLTDRHCYGHYNILYLDDGDILRVEENHPEIGDIWDSLTPGQALTIPHHTGDDAHCHDWNHYDARFTPLVEIFQVRGSYECTGCKMRPGLYGRGCVPDNSVRTGLNRGYRMGFTAGGEHEGVGVTAVYAAELTRRGVFEALLERRVYGSSCRGIEIDFRIDGRIFGSILPGRDPKRLFVKIKGTAPVDAVYLVCREAEYPLPCDGSPLFLYDGKPPFNKTPDWTYLRVEQADGNTAWASPIWFEGAY